MKLKEYFTKFKDYLHKLKSKENEYLENNKQIRRIRRIIKNILIVIIPFIIGVSIGVSNYNDIFDQYNELTDKYDKLEITNSELETKNTRLQVKVDEAKPWFELKESEQAQIEKENEEKRLAEEEQAKKLAEEEEAKRLAEEEEAAAEKLAEEKEKKGYDTGISYKDLARNPEDYIGEKVKFKGNVVQVMEGDGEVQIRLAVGGDYNNIIYCVYDSSIVSSRVLEDDYITVMGISSDLITYTSTIGGEITIPSMLVEKIDM